MKMNPPKSPAKPAALNASAEPKSSSATIKMASPEIRVGLDSIRQPKSSMIKRVGPKKTPTLTNDISMPKVPKIKKPKVMKAKKPKMP